MSSWILNCKNKTIEYPETCLYYEDGTYYCYPLIEPPEIESIIPKTIGEASYEKLCK